MVNLKIKDEVITLSKKLHENGYEVYIVGGCVRNLLTNHPVTDWDVATNATPEQIQTVFPDSFYDNSFGTVGVPYESDVEDEKKYIEITTFRHETNYDDKRHPTTIQWGKTIEEDLARRDFTMNAIALKLITKEQQITTDLIDPYNGQADIKAKLIRAVRDPNERFKEDALRLLRAIRFAAQLRFQIEDATYQAIMNDSELLRHISNERIRDELMKIISSDNPMYGIELLDQTGLLKLILPELVQGKGISQARPGRHHTTDVYTHNLLSLKHCPSTNPIVRFATLLHDIGKPDVMDFDGDNLVTFYNHEVVGSQKAASIADRLKFSKKEKQKIVTLIRWHMFTVDENITDSAIRRFIRRVGLENVKDMIDLRIGDRLGGGTQVAESWRLKKFKERIEEQLHPPFSINDMAIDGNDIMKELNLKPGPQIGKILKILFEEVDADLSKNTKEYLMKRLSEIQKMI